MSGGPPTRTLTLGLLAELAGAGAGFCTPPAFAAAACRHAGLDMAAREGARAPHAVTVTIDAPPQGALPFARAAAAAGIPVTFLLRMARGGSPARRQDGEAFTAIAGLGHGFGLVVPAGTTAGDLAATVAGQHGRGARLEALCTEDDGVARADMHALHAAADLPVTLGTITIAAGQDATVAFTLRIDRCSLVARSVTPDFGILEAPADALDAAAVACLADTVARGACLVGLRLSQLL